MSTASQLHEETTGTPSGTLVDPRAPRFGQAITASLLLLAVGLQQSLFVFAVAAILGVSVVTRWRVDVYRIVWKNLLLPIVGQPAERESAAPHRFAKLLGAVGSALASAFVLSGLPSLGFGIAALVGLLAGVAATTGFCLGCRMYRQVSFLRERGVV